ncbi:MAG: DUF4397 domain-containing protein [Chloroflexota bacterium]
MAHGIPGVAVDVCVNNGIVAKANFKYGQQFKASLPAGKYIFRVRLHTAVPCKGKVVIYKSLTLTEGLNATAVANVQGGKPHLSIFANSFTGVDGTHATVTVRHAASAPTVDVWVNGGSARSSQASPGAPRPARLRFPRACTPTGVRRGRASRSSGRARVEPGRAERLPDHRRGHVHAELPLHRHRPGRRHLALRVSSRARPLLGGRPFGSALLRAQHEAAVRCTGASFAISPTCSPGGRYPGRAGCSRSLPCVAPARVPPDALRAGVIREVFG